MTKNFLEIVPVAEIGGSWQVSFDPQWGGPAQPVTFAKLEDWTKRPEPGIRYYSGTAVYRTGFDVPPSTLRPPESRRFLDLGQVNHIARVRLNGQDLGVVWTAPWRVDISDAVHEQANRLEIEIANVWANRLIGDEQEPADCAWYPVSPANGWCLGTPLKELPDWFLKGESRPSTGRYCFTTWKYATGAMSLVPSGLLGPVRVMAAENVEHSSPPTRIVCPTDGTAMEILAAREVRRYWYLRTGHLLPIVPTWEHPSPAGGGFVVGRKDRAALRNIGGTGAWITTMAGLGPQQYLLRTIEQGGNRWLLIAGGDEVGTLYGAYRVAEHAGVRFYLHGDVVPDERLRAELPNLDEQGKPLFALRGINPFHDFPFGPDWWTTEDYKAIIAQLAKMRMNFIGFHCYAENSSHPAEPTVWTGLKGEFDDQGRVLVGYPSRLNHTMESPIPVGGFSVPMKTSDYRFGAAMLFDRDDAGSEAVAVASAQSDPVESQKAMFNHCGTMFREAFGLARVLGVKTCVGTEVPNRSSDPCHAGIRSRAAPGTGKRSGRSRGGAGGL